MRLTGFSKYGVDFEVYELETKGVVEYEFILSGNINDDEYDGMATIVLTEDQVDSLVERLIINMEARKQGASAEVEAAAVEMGLSRSEIERIKRA